MLPETLLRERAEGMPRLQVGVASSAAVLGGFCRRLRYASVGSTGKQSLILSPKEAASSRRFAALGSVGPGLSRLVTGEALVTFLTQTT